MTLEAKSTAVLEHIDLLAIYEGIGEGIIMVDAEHRNFIYASPSMCRMLGYSEAELLALSVANIHPPDSLPTVLAQFVAICERRLGRVDEVPMLRKDGSIFYADIIAAWLEHRGRPHVLGFFRDVTERKRATDLLRLERDLGEALAAVHDLPAALECILATATRIEGFDCGGIYLVTGVEDSQAVELVAHRGLSPEFVAAVSRYDMDSPCCKLLMERQPRYDVVSHSGLPFDPACVAEGLRAAAVIPIFHQGRLLASLNVASHTRDEIPLSARHALESIAAIVAEVLARLRAEQVCREAEEKFRQLVQRSAYGYVEIDLEGTILYANERMGKIMGMPPQAAVGQKFFTFFRREDEVAEAFARLEATLTAPLYTPKEYELAAADGTPRILQGTALPLTKNGKVVGFGCTVLDVTELRMAERAVRESEARLRNEQQLLLHLLELHEQERQLVAYEIHDGVSQPLTAARFAFEAAERLAAQGDPRARETFAQGLDFLAGAIDEARRLMSGLRPPVLDDLGVVAGIDHLVNECCENCGPRVEFLHDVDFDRLAGPIETALFRIAQEALRNACLHSRSERIRVELTASENTVRLSVRDWGTGFDPTDVEEGRFGLRGIRERARLLGGTATILSAPQQGTHIIVELPLLERKPDFSED
jgi:PAS domain S-box-containing protein